MKSKWLKLAPVLAATLLTISARAQEPQESTKTINSLTPEAVKEIVSTLELLKLPDDLIRTVIEKCVEAVANTTPDSVVQWRMEEPERAGQLSISFDSESGVIYQYSRLANIHFESEELKPLTHDDAISMEAAWESTEGLLMAKSPGFAADDFEGYFLDHSTMYQNDDLSGAFWSFKRTQDHDGFPCRLTRLDTQISAFNGEVVHYHYCPPLIPEKPEILVSVTEAIASAKAYLEGHKYYSSEYITILEVPHGRLREVIAPKYDGANGDDIPTRLENTRYCWEVPFLFEESHGDHALKGERYVWVDMETGIAIGSDYRLD